MKEIISEASITARPFFERKGFKVLTQQLVAVKGTTMTNYKMLLKIKQKFQARLTLPSGETKPNIIRKNFWLLHFQLVIC